MIAEAAPLRQRSGARPGQLALVVGVGILMANVVSTALNFVKGGPQKMQEMAMQTMMNQMMKQAMTAWPCPDCGAPIPKQPTDREQAPSGGGTCGKCGCSVDGQGRKTETG